MEPTREISQPIFSARALKLLIAPLILEQLLAMTVGMADTVMLTTVGEAAVSGVALVDVINNLVIQILAALATGGAVVCSQYLGRHDEHNAREAARQLLYTALVFALVMTGLLLGFRRIVLRTVFGNLEASVMDSAQVYFLFTGLSFPFLAIYNSCAALYRSMGNSHVSLLASALMNVINIGGNAILIYVLGMGAAGAAIATLVSRAIAAMLMLMLIRNHRNPIYLEQLHHVKFNSQMVRSILRIGIPSGMENGIFHFGKLIVQTLTASLGTSAIAANAIVNSISSILVVPGSAVGLSMITVVGQCVGAGDYRQAVQYTKKLMLLAYGCLLLLNLPLLLIYRPLIGLFHLSTEASNLAIQILPLLTITHIIFWPMAFTFPNALRAAGDARFTMIVSIISMWTLRVGMSYVLVLVFKLGLPGIWYAMYFDWILRIICFVIRFSGNRWKNKKVIL